MKSAMLVAMASAFLVVPAKARGGWPAPGLRKPLPALHLAAVAQARASKQTVDLTAHAYYPPLRVGRYADRSALSDQIARLGAYLEKAEPARP